MENKNSNLNFKGFGQYIINFTRGKLNKGASVDNALVTAIAKICLDVFKVGTTDIPLLQIRSKADAWKIVNEKMSEDVLKSIIDDVFLGEGEGSLYKNKAVLEDALFHPGLEENHHVPTPPSVTKLATNLLGLNIPDPDHFIRVADFGSGEGNFALDYNLMFPSKTDIIGFTMQFDSYDVDRKAISVANIRGRYLYDNYRVKYNRALIFKDLDVFKVFLDNLHSASPIKYDRIFSCYDWPKNKKIKYSALGGYSFEYVTNHIVHDKEDINYLAETSPEWIFNHLIMNFLKDDGKAVVVMSGGTLVNKSDKKLRDMFLQNGWIEKVIRLPRRLFVNSNASVYMLVLSKNNERVQFVDAAEFFESGRRYNSLSDENIADILTCCSAETDKCFEATNDMILSNDSQLLAERYVSNKFNSDYHFNNSDLPRTSSDENNLENYINKIKRGAPLTADKLDELDSKVPTDIQYLRLKDLVNNDIPRQLPYLKELDKSLEKYLLQDGDLVISKSAKPFKVAVAGIESDQKILPVGSMYALELDRTKVNPYYLQALFESKKGTELIVNASAGTIVTMIPVDMLKKIKLELPSIEVQNEKALVYMKYKERATALRRELAEMEFRLSKVLD